MPIVTGAAMATFNHRQIEALATQAKGGNLDAMRALVRIAYVDHGPEARRAEAERAVQAVYWKREGTER